MGADPHTALGWGDGVGGGQVGRGKGELAAFGAM